jgi:parvulin-like peptidyl-prolyl isomerase
MADNSNIREFPKNAVKKDKSVKNKALWIGSVVILGLAAVSFVFVPGAGRASARSGKAKPFGYYNKKPIEFAANSFFTQRVRALEEQTRGQKNADDALYEIFDRAFKDTVLNEAFSYAVEKSGYIAPEGAIDRAMIPYFSDQSGAYSPRLFNGTSNARKIEIRKEVTRQLVYRRYYEDLFGANDETISGTALYGRKISSRESAFLGRLGEKERSFELASFSVLSYPDDETTAFARNNEDKFTKYDLSVITVNGEDEAKTLARQIAGNEVLFDDAVKDMSLKFYSGDDGKLASPYRYAIKNIVPDDGNFDAVISLEPGAVSGAMQTSNGWSIFRCDAPPAIPDFTDGEVRGVVFNYIRTYERNVIEEYFINAANDFATTASQRGFASACAQFGVERVEVQSFPLNYGSSELFPIVPSIPQLNGAGRSAQFLRTAFSLKEGEISSPVVLGDNILVLRLLSEEIKEENENTAQFMVPYYSGIFDQNALQNAVFADPLLKNNFVDVFLSTVMGN